MFRRNVIETFTIMIYTPKHSKKSKSYFHCSTLLKNSIFSNKKKRHSNNCLSYAYFYGTTDILCISKIFSVWGHSPVSFINIYIYIYTYLFIFLYPFYIIYISIYIYTYIYMINIYYVPSV